MFLRTVVADEQSEILLATIPAANVNLIVFYNSTAINLNALQ